MTWNKSTLGDICDAGQGIIKTGPFGSQLHQSDYSDAGTQAQLFGAIHRSDDSGKTWRLISRIIRDNASVDEPAIAQLADGSILARARLFVFFRVSPWLEVPGQKVPGQSNRSE